MKRIHSDLFEPGFQGVSGEPPLKQARARSIVEVATSALASGSCQIIPDTARQVEKRPLGFKQKVLVVDLDQTVWHATHSGLKPEPLAEDCANFLKSVPPCIKSYQIAEHKLAISIRPIVAAEKTEWKKVFAKVALLQKKAQLANLPSPVLLHFMTSGQWEEKWSFDVLNKLYGDKDVRFGETLQATFDNRNSFSKDKALANHRKGVLMWQRFSESQGWKVANPALKEEDILLVDNDHRNNKGAEAFGFRTKLMPTTPRLAAKGESLNFSRDFAELIAELHRELDEALRWLESGSE